MKLLSNVAAGVLTLVSLNRHVVQLRHCSHFIDGKHALCNIKHSTYSIVFNYQQKRSRADITVDMIPEELRGLKVCWLLVENFD